MEAGGLINYKKDEPVKPDPLSRHGGRTKASEFSNACLR